MQEDGGFRMPPAPALPRAGTRKSSVERVIFPNADTKNKKIPLDRAFFILTANNGDDLVHNSIQHSAFSIGNTKEAHGLAVQMESA